MKAVLKVISFGSLVLMLAASILVFTGGIERNHYFAVSLIGTVGWFASMPFWMKRGLHQAD
jgi:hypothetical protein